MLESSKYEDIYLFIWSSTARIQAGVSLTISFLFISGESLEYWLGAPGDESVGLRFFSFGLMVSTWCLPGGKSFWAAREVRRATESFLRCLGMSIKWLFCEKPVVFFVCIIANLEWTNYKKVSRLRSKGAKRQPFCFLMRLCLSSGKLSFFYVRFALKGDKGKKKNRIDRLFFNKVNFTE